jgi:hypothetical protein
MADPYPELAHSDDLLVGVARGLVEIPAHYVNIVGQSPQIVVGLLT